MRFNKAELASLVTSPKTNFEREGLLLLTERQEGFFRKNDVSCPRWFKLRGNLLFYLKDNAHDSPPAGLFVLENCRPIIKTEEREVDGFAFILEFTGSWPQRFCARSFEERLEWVKCIQLASYTYLDRQIRHLREQLETATAALQRQMGNRIETGNIASCPFEEQGVEPGNDGMTFHNNHYSQHHNTHQQQQQQEQQQQRYLSQLPSAACSKDQEDLLSEVPLCETSLSCDSLPRTESGRQPSTRVVCAVPTPGADLVWTDYARTEIVEQSINPHFLCTICFRQSDGFHGQTPLRFTVYDVREKVSSTMVPIGYAEVQLGVIQDATHFRIPLRSMRGDCGFITIASWTPDHSEGLCINGTRPTPPRSVTQVFDERQTKSHRRSQSLPPKFGVKLFVPFHGGLERIFANAVRHTYRLQSSLGADIRLSEVMLESRLCFVIPQQLLSIWIAREKELLQEISGMGELGGIWRRRQVDLLDKHLRLLKNYSQAKQNLQQLTSSSHQELYFKQSSVKGDSTLEFVPVNLHLQRACAQTDALLRPHTRILDIITVGAFTRHQTKKTTTNNNNSASSSSSSSCSVNLSGHGGLIKLLQEHKVSSPSKLDASVNCKVQAANDAVQAVKQLRAEIVQIMSDLLAMAKHKHNQGMMPLCNQLIQRTKTLLHLWEPNLVNEAFTFIEQHRILEERETQNPADVSTSSGRTIQMFAAGGSSFRQITRQLDDLALKSPDLEDFATPLVAPPDLWPSVPVAARRELIFHEDHYKHPNHQQLRYPYNNHLCFNGTRLLRSSSLSELNVRMVMSPSTPLDLSAIQQLQQNIRKYNEEEMLQRATIPPLKRGYDEEENCYQSLPITLNEAEEAKDFDANYDSKRTGTEGVSPNSNVDLNANTERELSKIKGVLDDDENDVNANPRSEGNVQFKSEKIGNSATIRMETPFSSIDENPTFSVNNNNTPIIYTNDNLVNNTIAINNNNNPITNTINCGPIFETNEPIISVDNDPIIDTNENLLNNNTNNNPLISVNNNPNISTINTINTSCSDPITNRNNELPIDTINDPIIEANNSIIATSNYPIFIRNNPITSTINNPSLSVNNNPISTTNNPLIINSRNNSTFNVNNNQIINVNNSISSTNDPISNANNSPIFKTNDPIFKANNDPMVSANNPLNSTNDNSRIGANNDELKSDLNVHFGVNRNPSSNLKYLKPSAKNNALISNSKNSDLISNFQSNNWSTNPLSVNRNFLSNNNNDDKEYGSNSGIYESNQERNAGEERSPHKPNAILEEDGDAKEVTEFLDTKEMSTSPSANFYRPSEEPEPLDLTQLNIEASVMCLVSKIKFLCGRRSSPAIRLRQPRILNSDKGRAREGLSSSAGSSKGNTPRIPDIIDSNGFKSQVEGNEHKDSVQKPSDLDLTKSKAHRRGNKFTDGLDLSLTTDWCSELRPSMRKLRHAMDGLLKTARLMHSVTRLQQDMTRINRDLEVMYRRDVCFSQSLTALVSALMARLWGHEVTADYLRILFELGPLAYFEGLLSLYGAEIDMWGDMCVAIEDLASVGFTLVRCPTKQRQESVNSGVRLNNDDNHLATPTPRVIGSRQNMQVLLPVSEHVYQLSVALRKASRRDGCCTFNITPVFFNIGINERATIAETVGQTRDQHRSNCDNFSRLKQYYSRFRKLPGRMEDGMIVNRAIEEKLNAHFGQLDDQLKSNVSKNVRILHLAEDICRLLDGLRFTSCKSAKDRTGMAVTLEECRLLLQEFQLPTKNVPTVLNTLRCEGTRMDNVQKNIAKRKYAFNLPQVLSLPAMYRPPVGSYGKAET